MRGLVRLEFLAVAAAVALSGCKVGSSAGADPAGQTGASQTDNDAIPPNSIAGTVNFNGSPLSGVTVTLFLANSNVVVQTATTDSNGNYAFTGISATGDVPGDYQLWAQKSGYGFYPSVAAGAKVTRADFTGQFQGNGATDVGLYFTVIEYVSLPNASLAGANFTAYDGSHPLVTLASTGQQTSYAPADDAGQHQGLAWNASRFTDNADGTVTDTVTGLVWLKNAGCLPAAVWATALSEASGLAAGACGLTDGSKTGDWRLPNLNELESLVDVAASHPALTSGNPFLQVSTGIYWSSTSYFGGQAGSPYAWAIRMDDGRYINDGVLNNKISAANAVWAVRGLGRGPAKLAATGYYDEPGQQVPGDDGSIQAGVGLTWPRWIDNGNGTLTDSMTGLVWLKAADCILDTWSGSLARIHSLASGQCGLADGSSPGDWRMPNRNEIQSLEDRMVNNEADFMNAMFVWKGSGTVYQEPIFSNFVASSYYWTSTTDAADPTQAWTVFSCDFGVYNTLKSNSGYTLAVR